MSIQCVCYIFDFFFFSSRRRHTRCGRDWSSDVCSSDLGLHARAEGDDEPAEQHQQRTLDPHARRGTHERDAEIGRASCRETVQSTVVAVSLKKKIVKSKLGVGDNLDDRISLCDMPAMSE